MDGQYQNKIESLNRVLNTWIDNVITKKLWEKYVDLHIDEINIAFKEKHTWLDGSLFLFNCINKLIDSSIYEIILVIPLSCVLEPSKNDIINFESIMNEFDITPPSFYLFPKNNKNFEDTIKSAKYLNEISAKINLGVFFKETNEEREYYRTLYIRNLNSSVV